MFIISVIFFGNFSIVFIIIIKIPQVLIVIVIKIVNILLKITQRQEGRVQKTVQLTPRIILVSILAGSTKILQKNLINFHTTKCAFFLVRKSFQLPDLNFVRLRDSRLLLALRNVSLDGFNERFILSD